MAPKQLRQSMNIEVKQFGGRVVEHKEIERDGQLLGIIEVLLATWEPDTGGMFGVPDQFVQGAFAESLRLHRERDDRQVRMKNMHHHVIGGFPIETVVETSAGLFAIGEINLEMQEGKEVWALIKQGVLVDMSVGFSATEDVIENGLRTISKAILWEGSVVDEPANQGANILNFKSTPFADLPVADKGHKWDPVAAAMRVEKLAASENVELKSAYAQEGQGGALGNLIADVVEGSLVVIPQAVIDAAEALIDTEGTAPVVEHLERYLAKMGTESPLPPDQRRFIGASEAREMKAATMEKALASGVVFSSKAAKVLAARLTGSDTDAYDSRLIQRILQTLKEAKLDLV